MKIGDAIKHAPTGETWVVARILSNGDIFCAGWPCSLGKASEITLEEECSEEESAAMIERLKNMPADDPRHIARTVP